MAYGYDLAPDERRELLRIARATLREFVDSGRIPPGRPHRESLVAPAAVVASVWRGGVELGRSATLEDKPLYRAIQEQVVAAVRLARAAEPLTDDAVDELEIAVDILTAAAPIQLRESPRAQ